MGGFFLASSGSAMTGRNSMYAARVVGSIMNWWVPLSSTYLSFRMAGSWISTWGEEGGLRSWSRGGGGGGGS